MLADATASASGTRTVPSFTGSSSTTLADHTANGVGVNGTPLVVTGRRTFVDLTPTRALVDLTDRRTLVDLTDTRAVADLTDRRVMVDTTDTRTLVEV